MYLPVLILILIVAFALILIVMVQNPKGGGLSSSFGGNANTIGGVQNTNTFLDKATWTLAVALFVLILLSNFVIDRGVSTNAPTLDSTLEGVEKTVEKTAPAPADAEKTTTEDPKKEETKK